MGGGAVEGAFDIGYTRYYLFYNFFYFGWESSDGSSSRPKVPQCGNETKDAEVWVEFVFFNPLGGLYGSSAPMEFEIFLRP